MTPMSADTNSFVEQAPSRSEHPMKETVQVTQSARDEAHAIAVAWDAGRYDEAGSIVARLSATSAPAGVEGQARNLIESIARPFPPNCNWEDQARACQAIAEQILSILAAAPAPSGQEVAGEVPEGSAIGRALREVPDEVIRHVIDAKDVGTARARIVALMVDVRAALAAPAPSCAPATTPPASGVTVPEGMKEWGRHHPEYPKAPKDWDGGKVLWETPHGRDYSETTAEDRQWSVHPDDQYKIIAYTPAALSTPSATPGALDPATVAPSCAPGEVERDAATVDAVRRLQFKADFQRGYGADWFSLGRADADLILAALSPQGLDAKEGWE